MSADKINKKKSFWKRLRSKFRVMIVREDNYDVAANMELSLLNLFLLISTILVVLGYFMFALIAYSPLKHYLPGYGQVGDDKALFELRLKTDELEQKVETYDQYLGIIKKIVNNEIDTSALNEINGEVRKDSINLDEVSKEDSLFRIQIEEKERFSILDGSPSTSISELASYHFFKPLKGIVSDGFNARESHFGVDVVSKKGADVKAILDGRVILSDFTISSGYVIALQHQEDFISIYKHNSEIKKSVGDLVKAGDAIAIVGNTGEMSSGPHLHLEMWFKGSPINPEDYINFE